MYYLYLLLFYGTQLVFDLFFNDFLGSAVVNSKH